MLKPHFIALLNFLSEKEGGRKTPTSSGYRAGMKFQLLSEPSFGEFEFIDSELVYAGDTISAEITMVDFEKLKDSLYNGLDFNFYEGEILMGKGVITKMVKNEN